MVERDAQRCPRQRGRKAFASLFSTLRVKTFRGPSSGRSLPSLLYTCQNIFPISPLFPWFLSLSLSLLALCYITLSFDRVINFQFNRDRSRVLGKDRLIPSGLQTSTNLVVKFSLFPRIVNKTRIVFRTRVENIDTDDSCGE